MSHPFPTCSVLRIQSRKFGHSAVSLLGACAMMLVSSLGHAQTSTTDPADPTNSGLNTTTGATNVVNNSSLTLFGASTYTGTTTLSGGTLTFSNAGFNFGTTGSTTLINGTNVTQAVIDPLTLNFTNNFYNGFTINSGSSISSGNLIDLTPLTTFGSSISLNSAFSSGSVITMVGGTPTTVITSVGSSTLPFGSSVGTSLLNNANSGTITINFSGTNTAANMVSSSGTLTTSGSLVLRTGGVLNLTAISAAGLTVTGNTNVIGGTALGSTGLTLTSNGTTQSTGSVNVTALGSVPVGNTPTSVSFAAPSVALLGIGNVGAQGISERGVIYSLSSANGSPTLGASGVFKVVHTGLPTANGSFSLTAAGLAANTTYTYRVYAKDSTGATILSTPSTFTTPTVLQNWRQTFFGTTQGASSAADNADPDGDGVPNLLEFATGKNPTKSQNAASTAPSLNGGNLEYQYTRNLDALNSGITFTVEWNDTLNPTQWSSAGVTEVVLSDDGLQQQVKASVPSGSNGKRFIRLKVLPPPAQ